MGTTILVAIIFWLASSFIEYKIIKGAPQLRPFFNGIPGIILSILIGAVLALAVGASNAMPIVVAQIVGLATNEMMFEFFEKCGRTKAAVDVMVEKVQTKVEHVKEIEAAHPTLVADVKQTCADGAKVVAATGVGVLYVLGTPAKAVRGSRKLYDRTRSITKKGASVTKTGFDKSKAITTTVSGSVSKARSITKRAS